MLSNFAVSMFGIDKDSLFYREFDVRNQIGT